MNPAKSYETGSEGREFEPRPPRQDHSIIGISDEAEKALALPKPPDGASADRVEALPARPHVRVLDLVRACDGAAIAGDLHAVRALLASIVRALESDSLASIAPDRAVDRS